MEVTRQEEQLKKKEDELKKYKEDLEVRTGAMQDLEEKFRQVPACLLCFYYVISNMKH